MGNGPPNRLYVPSGVRAKLIHWAQLPIYLLTWKEHTVTILQNLFWWPSLTRMSKSKFLPAPSVLRTKPPLLHLSC